MNTDIPRILENIRISYEYEMGEYLEPDSRRRHKVELRNALVNAAKPYGTCAQLATMVGKANHTTTIHCMKEHEVYHNFSPQYRRNYAKALEVVEKFARRHQLLPRLNGQRGGSSSLESEIRTINMSIAALQSRRDRMIESLESSRQIAKFDNSSTI
jgi:hypothetical protein|tara:strand:+ start:418 stop:888 length:471 start_codon:yes stop_codon:yes gene_type:complete